MAAIGRRNTGLLEVSVGRELRAECHGIRQKQKSRKRKGKGSNEPCFRLPHTHHPSTRAFQPAGPILLDPFQRRTPSLSFFSDDDLGNANNHNKFKLQAQRKIVTWYRGACRAPKDRERPMAACGATTNFWQVGWAMVTGGSISIFQGCCSCRVR